VKSRPLISVITISYNSAETIQRTIKSVLTQDFKNFEYIVIDGGSTDGTKAILEQNDDNIDYWASEKDNGIYDAMNKGAKAAKGKYLYFLNSDDYFYNDQVLAEVGGKMRKDNVDLIIGKIIKVYPKYNVKKFKKYSEKLLKKGVMPFHQASFVLKRLFWQVGGFYDKYKSSGDFDFFCKLSRKQIKVNYLNSVIAIFKAGGMSSQKKISLVETFKIIKRHFGVIWALKFALKKIVIEQGLKKILLMLKLDRVYKYLSKLHNKGKI